MPQRSALMSAALLWLAGCVTMLPAPTPMAKVERAPEAGPRCILLLLPGFGDHATEFEQHGFLALVEKRRLSVLTVAADATAGYYYRGSMQQRVTTDVVAPLRQQYPHAELWVSGMSMGGLGTLLFAMEHPGEVAGVLLMAPYLGDGKVAGEVRAHGGLRHWQAPPVAARTSENFDRQLWRWLQETTAPGAAGPSVYLGYGKQDGLAEDDGTLAAALPADHFRLVDGGHDWPYWQPIFEGFLDSREFQSRCGPAGT